MKTFAKSLLLATALFVCLGCEKSQPGGPGATNPPSTNLLDKFKPMDANAFEFNEALTPLFLKHGEKKELDLSIKRGSEFKQTVRVKVEALTGLKVLDADGKEIKHELEIKPADTKAKVWIEAAKDAPVGDSKLTITGTPETGKPTSYQQTVTVTKD